jgi:hypothetical protein
MVIVILRRMGLFICLFLSLVSMTINPELTAAELAPVPQTVSPRLTTAHELLSLGLDTVRQAPFPVRLQGLVTYPDMAAHIIYVQDRSAGFVSCIPTLITYPFRGRW